MLDVDTRLLFQNIDAYGIKRKQKQNRVVTDSGRPHKKQELAIRLMLR